MVYRHFPPPPPREPIILRDLAGPEEEAAALGDIVRTLGRLDVNARERVLRAVVAFFAMEILSR